VIVTAAQTHVAGTKPKAKPPSTASSAKQLKRNDIDASMVGYIDDATVGSEVRVRFDAGFNDPRPDRAEYFYAGCTCLEPPSAAVQRTLNFQELYLGGEYAPVRRFSISTVIPFRWIQPFFYPSPTLTPTLFNAGGISDVQAALKFAAVASPMRKLTLQLGATFPSGDGGEGLGTNHYSLEPMVLYYQRLSDRAAIEAEAGDSHPIGGAVYTAPGATPQNFAGDVFMYGAGPSYRVVDRDTFYVAPVIEFVAWHVFGGLETGANNVIQPAGGTNIVNIKVGARMGFHNGSSIYAGYGHALTSQIWYENLLRVEYRYSF
jgi:hypothetical protein